MNPSKSANAGISATKIQDIEEADASDGNESYDSFEIKYKLKKLRERKNNLQDNRFFVEALNIAKTFTDDLQENKLDNDNKSEDNSTENSEGDNINLDHASFNEGVNPNMDWLLAGYDWKAIIPPEEAKQIKKRNAKTTPLEISDSLFDSHYGITEKDAVARCKFLNQEINKENINNATDAICFLRDKISNKIKSLLKYFMVDIANRLGFKVNKKRVIINWNDFLTAAKYVKGLEDGKNMVKIMYLSFDHLPNFETNLGKVILWYFNLKIVKDENVPKTGFSQSNFLTQFINSQLSEVRKRINDNSGKDNGWKYTIVRSAEVKARMNGKNRIKRYFYNWMIQGDLVSY